jgi:hypothetical protein
MPNQTIERADVSGFVALRTAAVAQDESFNFSLAKVVAILLVVFGHWGVNSLFWIPVTFGLFVFAFSSAYFTSRIYGLNVDTGRFWRRKLERLGLRYWIILSFIAALSLAEGKTVLHWHTLVHYIGLSGVINWAGLPSQSALGAGLWFFTLLLLFYLAYPFLARASRTPLRAGLLALASSVVAVWLQGHVNVGHALWLTVLGFILGVVYGMHKRQVHPGMALLLTVSSCLLLAVLNVVAGYGGMNPALIACASIGIVLWLANGRIASLAPLVQLARLEKYLLEIFLIHTYLFVHPTGNRLADLVLSLITILCAAVVIHHTAARLAGWVFDRAAVRAQPAL